MNADRIELIQALASAVKPTVADEQTIDQWTRRAASAMLACTPLESLRKMPAGFREEASILIEFGMQHGDRALMARRWGIKGKPETITRQLLNALHGRPLDTGAQSPATVPVGTPPPAAAQQWQPVKGKPGRQKLIRPGKKPLYRDVPMQKADESHRDYIARLCALVHALGAT